MPEVCVLDPDCDMVRPLRATGRAHQDPAWACYHTDVYRLTEAGLELALIGCAVGAPFAVLVAEQLIARRSRLLTLHTAYPCSRQPTSLSVGDGDRGPHCPRAIGSRG